MSCPVAAVQLRRRIRLTEKKSAQVHCCRKIEALVFLLANSMIVRLGMFFNYEKRRHARKCVIWPILGTSFSTNRHIFTIYIHNIDGLKELYHSHMYIYIYIYIHIIVPSKTKWLVKKSTIWMKMYISSQKLLDFSFSHLNVQGCVCRIPVSTDNQFIRVKPTRIASYLANTFDLGKGWANLST